MACARRESQRQLALDVWRLWTDRKFDVSDFIYTGAIQPYLPIGTWALPDTPVMREAMEHARREAEKYRRG